jgi:predicted nucleic acid-binding protein
MSAERFTLDSNILVYAFDLHEQRRRELARALLDAVVARDCPLAVQTIGEFYSAATKKLKLTPMSVAADAELFLTSFETYSYSANAMKRGLEEAARGRLSLWDAVLLASAAEAGCILLLSEDMQDGLRFGSLTVANPFGPEGFSERVRLLLAD